MNLESTLVQSGILGIWTLTLLYEKAITQKQLTEEKKEFSTVIKNNTIALTEVKTVMSNCQKK